MLKYEIIDVFCVKNTFKSKNVIFWGTSSP